MSKRPNIPDDHSTVINIENILDGVTQSEMTTMDDCAEKWYLGYNHLLKLDGTYAMYFIYGDGVHSSIEHWLKTGGDRKVATLQFPEDVFPDQAMEDDLYKHQRILDVQMERYFQYYENDLSLKTETVEETFDFMFEDVRLRGKVDWEYAGEQGLIVSDHKTGTVFDTTGWQFRFQFMFYAWAAQKRHPSRPIDWMMTNGIKKPLLRQGKTETFESYVERIRADMISEPTKYFIREFLDIQPALDRFEKRTLMPKINRIKLLTQANASDTLIESLVRQQNTNHCTKFGSKQKCQFLNICKNGWETEGFAYRTRDSKHQELDVEE